MPERCNVEYAILAPRELTELVVHHCVSFNNSFDHALFAFLSICPATSGKRFMRRRSGAFHIADSRVFQITVFSKLKVAFSDSSETLSILIYAVPFPRNRSKRRKQYRECEEVVLILAFLSLKQKCSFQQLAWQWLHAIVSDCE
jgi:hypothetical protein